MCNESHLSSTYLWNLFFDTKKYANFVMKKNLRKLKIAFISGRQEISSIDVDSSGKYEPDLNCHWTVVGQDYGIIKLRSYFFFTSIYDKFFLGEDYKAQICEMFFLRLILIHIFIFICLFFSVCIRISRI